ncbi:hypothetical protein K0M31_016569 [Melipona bicolor]|uniref:Uncharacterized protein n=1 Tax=Melipona bicolor TaxID=60889 RepID=A0AA40KES1_9HYME|nr:hypothetical protein K0M31_016569 [Melipona bicolor]
MIIYYYLYYLVYITCNPVLTKFVFTVVVHSFASNLNFISIPAAKVTTSKARETEKKERTLRFGENPNTIPETHGSQPLNPTPYQHTSRQSSSWTRRPGQMPGYQQWKQCVLTTRRDATLRGVTTAPRSLRAVPVPGHFTPSARTSQDHASCRYRGKQDYRSNFPTIDHSTE